MFKRIVTLMSIAALFSAYSIPASAQTTEAEYQAQFEAELYEYAATHSEDEARAYAYSRLDQLTSTNLISEPAQTNPLEAGIAPEILYGPEEFTTDIYLDLDRDFNSDSRLRECTRRKQEECRTNYNAELLTSAAIATGIFAGCNAITAFTAFVVCVAAALAAHMLMIQAARGRYQTCFNNAPWNCRKELGML